MDRMAAIALNPVNVMEQESAEIARALRRRDPELIDVLIERYQYRLFRYLVTLTGNRDTASDVFQETWIRVLERGHKYNGKAGFDAWLFTVARNLFIDKVMRKKRGSLSLDELEEGPTLSSPGGRPPEASPLDQLVRDETNERVSGALGLLPMACREALLLRFREELPLEEIARIVSAPLSTVKSRIYRGLEALRALLEGSKR